MSGGHFNYDQYKIQDMVDSIAREIARNGTTDEYGYKREYTAETVAAFREGIALLQLAQIYAHRIDWFLSGDDGQEIFLKRLKQELSVPLPAIPPSAAEVK